VLTFKKIKYFPVMKDNLALAEHLANDTRFASLSHGIHRSVSHKYIQSPRVTDLCVLLFYLLTKPWHSLLRKIPCPSALSKTGLSEADDQPVRAILGLPQLCQHPLKQNQTELLRPTLLLQKWYVSSWRPPAKAALHLPLKLSDPNSWTWWGFQKGFSPTAG